MDDNTIVDLYLQRNENAIKETTLKYGKRLRALSYSIVCDSQTAEECENDTYVEAWGAIPPHEPREYLYAFLARIVRHVSLNCCRNRRRLKRQAVICELDAELERCIPSPDDGACRLDDIVLRDVLNSFLASLDETRRNMFVRRYWYLDSVADISRRFALSESNVKTTLYRCRERLREYLEREGYTL